MKFHITLRARLVLLVMAAIVPLLLLSVAKAIWQVKYNVLQVCVWIRTLVPVKSLGC